MKGDFSRMMSRKRYHSVLKQQGRVELDADWNVHAETREALARSTRADVIGKSGAPEGNDAFRVHVTEEGEIVFSPGRFYVDGILCEVAGTRVAAEVLDDTRVRVERWNPDASPFEEGQWVEVQAPGRTAVWTRIASADPASSRITLEGGVNALKGPDVTVRRLLTANAQPDHPGVRLKPRPGKADLLFLDVWDRHVTAIEDPDVRDRALGGPDTTTRVQTVWQLKALPDPRPRDEKGAPDCGKPLEGWPPRPSGARLTTSVTTPPPSPDPCEVTPGGGYRGVENRLYRVEVHDPGQPYAWPRPPAPATKGKLTAGSREVEVKDWDLEARAWERGHVVEIYSDETDAQGMGGLLARVTATDPSKKKLTLDVLTRNKDLAAIAGHANLRLRRVGTFKWSRDNGALAIPVESFSEDAGDKVRVATLGRDSLLSLSLGDWVEVSGDETDLTGGPGTLAEVLDVDEDELVLTLSKDVSRHRDEGHPKVRRWDQGDDALPVETGLFTLEEGVRARFTGRDLRVGDWWVFAARTATQDVERLVEAHPRGVEHHYARLALVEWTRVDGEVVAEVRDCRNLFSSLTELPAGGPGCCTVTVGDGVATVGDYDDIQEAIDSLEGPGTVCVLRGEHRLRRTLRLQKKKGITLEGCGRLARIVAPGDHPALRVEGCEDVTLDALHVQAASEAGAVVVEASQGVRVVACTVTNATRGEAASPEADVTPDSEGKEKSPFATDPKGSPWGRRAVAYSKTAPTESEAKAVELTDEQAEAILRWIRATAPRSPGPAIAVSGSEGVDAVENELLGLPAVSLEAETVSILRNRATGGGFWIRDGAAGIVVEDNDIGDGEGPGIRLGSLPEGAKPGRRTTGVVGVLLRNNRIRRMSGSGVETPPFPTGKANAVGDVEDLLVEGNRISECAHRAPAGAPQTWAVGAIVLRNATGVRVHGNHLQGNGLGRTPACGVFAEGCRGFTATDNVVVGNGTGGDGPRATAVVAFDGADVPHYGPNPRTVEGATFLVEDANGPKQQTQVTGASPRDRGLDCGLRTTITLPEPAPFVELRLRWGDQTPLVKAYDVQGKPVRGGRAPESPGDPWRIKGAIIRRVVVEDKSEATLLQGLRFENGPAAYQAGIALLGALPLEDAGEEETKPAWHAFLKKKTKATGSWPTASAAGGPRGLPTGVVVHDNVVDCPRGQALLVTALCDVSVADNALRSGGRRDQPGLSRETHPYAGACVFIHDLGRGPVLSNALLAYGVETGVHVEHSEATRSDPFPEPRGAYRARLPSGRVRFEGNHVGLRDATPSEAATACAVTLLSRDSAALEGNEIASELQEGFLVTDALGLAPAVRAIGNHVTEIPLQAAHSLITAGLQNVVACNESTHCVSTRGNDAETALNQVLLPDPCDALSSTRSAKLADAGDYARISAGVEHLLRAASRADAGALLDLAGDLKARAGRLLAAAERVSRQPGSPADPSHDLRRAALALAALAQETRGEATRASGRLTPSDREWVVFGRVLDREGNPVPDAPVALAFEVNDETYEARSTATDEFGDFAFEIHETKLGEARTESVDVFLHVKDRQGRVLHRTRDRVRFRAGGVEYFEIVVAPDQEASAATGARPPQGWWYAMASTTRHNG